MPSNLSFRESRSTGAFYTDIHSAMAQRSQTDALPPTADEFAAWVGRRFDRVAGLSALDCGCGLHAFNARTCKRAGFGAVSAIDANPDVVRYWGAKNIGIQFECASVLDIPYEDARFDLVICSGVAHHTRDPAQAFHEIARVLKDDGVAYISLYTFRRSLADFVVRALRLMSHVVSYKLAQRISERSVFLNNFVLDHMYVPILWLYTAADARAEFADAGLVVEDEFPTSFDIFCGCPFGRSISGDGLLRVFVCRKR